METGSASSEAEVRPMYVKSDPFCFRVTQLTGRGS